MIHVGTADIFGSSCEALVNPVNTIGTMGKGLALAFRKHFPESSKLYMNHCEMGLMEVGKIYPTFTGFERPAKWIIHFPTKKHWKNHSELKWIADGLVDMCKFIKERKIKSVAIPMLGCGLGGLEWKDVSPLMVENFQKVDGVDFHILAPKIYF